MFSIIIPVYNKAHCLAVTLNSVLNQTHTHYEVILVDDGSTDDSVAVIKGFNDPRITLISQPNGGVSTARNTGIKNAKGDWIAFLDADDWWHPEYLQTQIQILKNYPNALATSTGFYSKADQPNWLPIPWKVKGVTGKHIEKIENLPKRWMQGIPFFTSSFCVERNFLKTFKPWFAVGEASGEDLDLWFKICEQTAIYHVSQPLTVYRTEQNNSLAGQHNWKSIPPYLQRAAERANKMTNNKELQRATRLFIAHHWLTNARKAIYDHQRLNALKLIWRARYAILTKRWWFSVIMTLFLPKKVIASWQKRQHKTQELK